ncbi:hypothetical protein GON03_19435 [Nocardioides sp. MAH-18]|uniref:Uncharacterized protein n=1 Tax=Nocardioides agri TaxID=2682843 RepID=A0A6L6XW01_9ACTN|nr:MULTISPECIES: hypothetical protein [unclassified Nocardioides]MBA2952193.1 hypothetical protein [Nocardioides sp. CGMCC 1.13656]MVQ51359.1 hypothetical protein [Nocardioides sp. MAH-18]
MAVQRSLWDDPRVKPKGARFAKFNDIGDEHEGVIAEVTIQLFDEGRDTEKAVPKLIFEDGTEVTCSASNLHRMMYEQRPEVGDHIRIRYVGDDDADYNRKLFDVDIVRADPSF